MIRYGADGEIISRRGKEADVKPVHMEAARVTMHLTNPMAWNAMKAAFRADGVTGKDLEFETRLAWAARKVIRREERAARQAIR